jgi:cell division septation protein DedD
MQSIQSKKIETQVEKWMLSLVLAIFGVIAGSASVCFAFSFEGIEIQSKFGERFSAELKVLLDEEGEFQVQIGNEADYRRLELKRPRVIDDLKIVASEETDALKKTIRVISKGPLFFPSFNLIMRGTFKGGTLLENYLVAVDFQQNLALNVQGQKKQTPETFPEKEEVDLLKGGNASVKSTASKETLNEPMAKAEPKEVAGEETPSGTSPRVSAPSWMAKAPTELKGARGQDSFFPGATWVGKRGFPDKMPPFDPSELQVDGNEEMGRVLENEPAEPPVSSDIAVTSESQNDGNTGSQGSGYGPLAQGENLLTIAKKLNVAGADITSVAVALWMENPENFMYGNMNGIREGGRLNLENLKQRLEEIESKMAKEVLRSQWQEWKVIRKKRSGLENEVFAGMTEEIPLPSENEDEKKMIFEMLRYWKQSWESGDLDNHLKHFSDQSSSLSKNNFSDLRFLKKRMFARHNQVKLRIQQASLVLNEGQTMVSFGQSFSSGKMESYGLKDIGVVWEDGAWKILKEKFKVNEYLEKHTSNYTVPEEEEIFSRERTVSAPFVIHASSHLDFQTATQAVNQLRRVGFNAYSFPINISRSKRIFRVYVGRFPNQDMAQEISLKLKRHAFSRYAIPVKSPYTLMMGEFEIEDEAGTLILNLRSLGFSPLLFTYSEKEFLNPRFRVFVGAFATEKETVKLSRELQAKNLSHELITP